jgi:D-3-phosphoglycerate dehydrogenase
VDNVDLAAAEELGIWVTNTPLANSASVAEHVLMLMLECVRNAYGVTKAFRGGKRDFDVRNRYVGIELSGKTLGIIGLGRIGKLLGQKAADGLGMRVLGYDPYLPEGALLPGVDRAGSIEAVLREADFVTLHMPATPTTVKSFTIRQFKTDEETAYFINASGGKSLPKRI